MTALDFVSFYFQKFKNVVLMTPVKTALSDEGATAAFELLFLAYLAHLSKS